jgi:hypothetical protein
MFNMLMLEISDTNKLERLRMFVFTPDKELMRQMSRILYPKLQLIFPETVDEKKLTSFLCEYSNGLKIEGEKLYFSLNNSEPHYGSYIELSDKKINYKFLTN